MSFETVTKTIRNILFVEGTSCKIELFRLSEDPHDQERFRRRRRVKVGGRDTYVPTVEDVIITKLRWTLLGQRNKDWEDIRNVIAVQAERIDWEYVHG